MIQNNVHLLDLPNEIFFLILKKLDNIDVLYSLFGINNQRLDIIAHEQNFSNILNFVSISQSTDEISLICGSILDRFSNEILPRIHQNVTSLTLDSVSMECILRAGSYPNLTELKLFNFNKEVISRYFIDNSFFGRICKQQITDLILIYENNTEIIENVCTIILRFFENLKHLNFASSSVNNYPALSLRHLPRTTFFSSPLTKLCINVHDFADIYRLLDGRFKQLTTLIVEVDSVEKHGSIYYNMDSLNNLKCFSLICYDETEAYDNRIVPLLHRMSHLEELTLYINILNGPTFMSGTHLDNEVLIHMPRLRTFEFYIACTNEIDDDTDIRVSIDDIQETFTHIKYRPIICMVDYCNRLDMMCRVFSLPFKFHRLEHIGNNIPNIVFDSVTHLKLNDKDPFKHEFFVRLARAFPFLKSLFVSNRNPPFYALDEFDLRDEDWCSIVEYPHLISLEFDYAHVHYIKSFLNEKKTYLPCLTELKIRFEYLEKATQNFTRDEMRRNCAKVKRLVVQHAMVYPKDVYCYFPCLYL